MERLAAGGFRDITRIASSNPKCGVIYYYIIKKLCLQLIKQWQIEMVQVEKMLLEEDGENILQYFQKAKQLRDSLPSKDQGAIPAFYDLFVDVPDYPGIISEITGYLAKEKISITNIRILETREDIYGVLVISFQTEEDRLGQKSEFIIYSDYDHYGFRPRESYERVIKWIQSKLNMTYKCLTGLTGTIHYQEINPFPIARLCSVLLQKVRQK